VAGIFKAYDIRGIYGDTITETIVRDIGRAFATFLGCRKVIVGRDMRPHSQPLFEALAEGLTLQGADVVDLGLCTTPMSYFANGHLDGDAGIMITASHNPGEWNGMKLSRAGAVPISGSTGIAEIETLVAERAFAPPADRRGTVSRVDILPAYREHVGRLAHLARPLRIVADMANAMGVYEARALEGLLEIDPLFDELDGTFPNHEANPLKTETLETLCARVRETGADFGVAFDGDADRAGFVDDRGEVIPMDLVTALIARDLLRSGPGVVLYDLRSSRAVKEVIEEAGGRALMSRVGHAFIKQQMRDHDAVFAGELSGHYYFRDNYFTESSSMAVIGVANIVSAADRPLSALIDALRRYHASGEINFTVEDPDAVLERLRHQYSDGDVLDLDGISVNYDDWWFNVRKSNTEPLVRLNLEADSPERLAAQQAELVRIIKA
jgi:phosphomannomutase